MTDIINYFGVLPPSDILSSSSSSSLSLSSSIPSSDEGKDTVPIDYLFGYGSIINNASRIATAVSSVSSSSSAAAAAAATLSTKFGYRRSWCFRALTGFTALGLEPISSTMSTTYDSIHSVDSGSVRVIGEDNGIFGVLMPIAHPVMLQAFDQREVGYQRIEIPLDMIAVLTEYGTVDNKEFATSLVKLFATEKKIRIWVYVPDSPRYLSPDEEYPILQTYVDVCIRGCLDWGGISCAKDFLRNTFGWCEYYLNDAPLSRRPWLHRPDYQIIDTCLEELRHHVMFHERRHSEEFASHHLTKLAGMWNVPTRNVSFVGREHHLRMMFNKLMGELDGRSGMLQTSSISKIQVVGTGGVGKTQLSVEYCHMHFGVSYDLIAFFRAETPAMIASEMRRFAVDMGLLPKDAMPEGAPEDDVVAGFDDEVKNSTQQGNRSKKESVSENLSETNDLLRIDDSEVVEIVKRKLARCRGRWLIIFDNMDDPSNVAAFLPRHKLSSTTSAMHMASRTEIADTSLSCIGGHVVITSRVTSNSFNSPILNKIQCEFIPTLLLDCFDKIESFQYLVTALYKQITTPLGSPHYFETISNGIDELEDDKLESKSHEVCIKSDIDPMERKYLEQLSERMGHLPLALAQAVAYIIRCDVTVAEYLNRLDALMIAGIEGEYSIVSSLSISLGRITQESPRALRVVILLGFLAPDGITKQMMTRLLENSKCAVSIQSDPVKLAKRNDPSIDAEQLDFVGGTKDDAASRLGFIIALTICSSGGFILGRLSTSFQRSKQRLSSVIGLTFVTIFAATIPTMLCSSINTIGLGNIRQSMSRMVLSKSINAEDVLEATTISTCLSDLQPVHVSNEPSSPEQLLYETDRIWELLKQFSILTVHGTRQHRVASIHRLHQTVLRSRCLAPYHKSANSGNQHSSNKVLVIFEFEQCLTTVKQLWCFDASIVSTWNSAGHILSHILALMRNMDFDVFTIIIEDDLFRTNPDPPDSAKFALGVRERFLREFAVLLTEAAAYAMIVLSRFDVAQNVLEFATNLHQRLALARKVTDNFYGQVRSIDISNTLHSLGKVLRIRGQLERAAYVLQEALSLRMSVESATIADTLHELGVVFLRKHDNSKAQEYLSQSLALKQERNSVDGLESGSMLETTEAATLHQLSVVALANSDYDLAESLLERALLLEGGHALPGVLVPTNDIIDAANPTRDYLQASKDGHQSRQTLNANVYYGYTSSSLISRAATLQQLGRLSIRRGRLDEAEFRLSSALHLYTHVYGELKAMRHINVIGVRHQLGNCLFAMRQYVAASEQFSIALASRELLHGQNEIEKGPSQPSGEPVHVTETSGASQREILLELQSLAQSELMLGHLDNAGNFFRRQRSIAESELKSISRQCNFEGRTISIPVNSPLRRELEAFVRFLLFSLHSLKTISNRLGQRLVAKELSKETQRVVKMYGAVLRTAGDSSNSKELLQAAEGNTEPGVARSFGESRDIVFQLLLTARKQVREVVVRIAKCIPKKKLKFAGGAHDGDDSDVASSPVLPPDTKFSTSFIDALVELRHSILSILTQLSSNTDSIGVDASNAKIRTLGETFIQRILSLIDKPSSDSDAGLPSSLEEIQIFCATVFSECDSIRLEVKKQGIIIEDV